MTQDLRGVRAADRGADAGTSRPRRRGRRVLAVLVLAALLPVVSVGRALTAPGTDSTGARLAEWGRGHGMSTLVDRLERATYTAPAAGGAPRPGSPLRAAPGGSAPAGSAPAGSGAAAAGSGSAAGPGAVLAPVAALASPALPGEGVWRVLLRSGGRPALQEAFLRPDAVHTSYTAGLVWMDPGRLRFVLHPGTEEPGHGPWPQPPALSGAARTGLVAAFNGGFRLDAARGGFYEGGRSVGRLRVGAASLVIDTSGRAAVGQWGRDVHLSSSVAAVRQNLDLVVDAGRVVAGLDDNSGGRWGRTLGNRLYVFRSGIGQTASGALVYVSGNRLSAATLAELLRRAGCVRAMELDINPEWTSFVSYPAERNLLPDMQRSPRRYDTTSTRDFVAVLQRP